MSVWEGGGEGWVESGGWGRGWGDELWPGNGEQKGQGYGIHTTKLISNPQDACE